MLDFLIVAACLIINAFFSAYEMAFVTITKDELDDIEESSKSTMRRLSLFKKKPERTLSVIQIGITLVGAIAAAVGGTGAVESLEPYMVERFGLSKSFAEGLSVTVVILPLTYFSVVFGELLPKTIALKHPEKVLTLGTGILSFIDRMLYPIVTFLEISTNTLLKLSGLGGPQEEDESLGQTVEIGNLPDYHQKFVQNLVSLKGQKVAKTMIPWNKVTYLNFSDTEEEVRQKINSTPHSRFPVIDGETLVGVLYLKELPDQQRQPSIPWQGVLRPAIKVSDTERVLEAFLKMQEKHTHLAVVGNPDGGFVGIITIEDILEEVVGDIYDNADQGRISKMLSHRSKINFKT